jgi:hypothetical protein
MTSSGIEPPTLTACSAVPQQTAPPRAPHSYRLHCAIVMREVSLREENNGVFENRDLKRTFRSKARAVRGSYECCLTLWITSFIWTAYTEDTSSCTKSTRQVVFVRRKNWVRPFRWNNLNLLTEPYTKHILYRYKAELLNIMLLVSIVTAGIWNVKKDAS